MRVSVTYDALVFLITFVFLLSPFSSLVFFKSYLEILIKIGWGLEVLLFLLLFCFMFDKLSQSVRYVTRFYIDICN